MKKYIVLCALLLTGIATSCNSPLDYDADRWSDEDTTKREPSTKEIVGTEWKLQYFEMVGNNIQKDFVPSGERFTIRFDSDSVARGAVNCNEFTVLFSVGTTPDATGDMPLSFSDYGATKAGCAVNSYDMKFSEALRTANKYYISDMFSGSTDDILDIWYNEGNSTKHRMVFSRITPPLATNLLKGTDWTLYEVEVSDNITDIFYPGITLPDYTLSFTQDGMVSGKTECTTYKAEYLALPIDYEQTGQFKFTKVIPATSCNKMSDDFITALQNVSEYSLTSTGNFERLLLSYTPKNSTKSLKLIFRKSIIGTDATVKIVFPLPSQVPFDFFQFMPQISGDILTIHAEYLGGCAIHEFALYAEVDSTASTMSNEVKMLLSHNANSDKCKNNTEENLLFNLGPLKEQYRKITGNSNGNLNLEITAPGSGMTFMVIYKF